MPVPLSEWFKAELMPGDLEHRRRSIPMVRYNEWGSSHWHRTSPESLAVAARLAAAEAKLRRLCAAGERELWGCSRRPDGTLGALQKFDLPGSEWSRVRFNKLSSRLRYLTFELVGVEVREPGEKTIAVADPPEMVPGSETAEPTRPAFGTLGLRSPGRPTLAAKVEAAFNKLAAEAKIDFSKPMTRTYGPIRQEITGSAEISKGLGKEAIRNVIAPLFAVRKKSQKL